MLDVTNLAKLYLTNVTQYAAHTRLNYWAIQTQYSAVWYRRHTHRRNARNVGTVHYFL